MVLQRAFKVALPGACGVVGGRGSARGPLEAAVLRCRPPPCSSCCRCPDLTFAFLDDVCLAGNCRHVASALHRLLAVAHQAGLQLNPSKSKLVACAGAASEVDMGLFPAGTPLNHSGATSLLGAPVGDKDYCNAFTAKHRVDRARPLLQALGGFSDPQTGLLLLRHCASFCKMLFACRVTPPGLQALAAADFDTAVQACLEELCAGPLPARASQQASLGSSMGGLGLRSAARHNAAAYTASVVAARAQCCALDAAYRASWPLTNEALTALNANLLPRDGGQVWRPRPVLPASVLTSTRLSSALSKACSSCRSWLRALGAGGGPQPRKCSLSWVGPWPRAAAIWRQSRPTAWGRPCPSPYNVKTPALSSAGVRWIAHGRPACQPLEPAIDVWLGLHQPRVETRSGGLSHLPAILLLSHGRASCLSKCGWALAEVRNLMQE